MLQTQFFTSLALVHGVFVLGTEQVSRDHKQVMLCPPTHCLPEVFINKMPGSHANAHLPLLSRLLKGQPLGKTGKNAWLSTPMLLLLSVLIHRLENHVRQEFSLCDSYNRSLCLPKKWMMQERKRELPPWATQLLTYLDLQQLCY